MPLMCRFGLPVGSPLPPRLAATGVLNTPGSVTVGQFVDSGATINGNNLILLASPIPSLVHIEVTDAPHLSNDPDGVQAASANRRVVSRGAQEQKSASSSKAPPTCGHGRNSCSDRRIRSGHLRSDFTRRIESQQFLAPAVVLSFCLSVRIHASFQNSQHAGWELIRKLNVFCGLLKSRGGRGGI